MRPQRSWVSDRGAGSEAFGAVRRTEAVCSHGTRYRLQSQSLSDGRAFVQPGRQAPGTDAGGNRQPVS